MSKDFVSKDFNPCATDVDLEKIAAQIEEELRQEGIEKPADLDAYYKRQPDGNRIRYYEGYIADGEDEAIPDKALAEELIEKYLTASKERVNHQNIRDRELRDSMRAQGCSEEAITRTLERLHNKQPDYVPEILQAIFRQENKA